jgi:hypothetical protein
VTEVYLGAVMTRCSLVPEPPISATLQDSGEKRWTQRLEVNL